MTTAALTLRQAKALAAIEAYVAEHGQPPGVRALAAILGKSVGTTHRMIVMLTRKGALTHNPRRHPAIGIVRRNTLSFLPAELEIQVQELARLAKCRPEDIAAEAIRDGIKAFRERSRIGPKSGEKCFPGNTDGPWLPAVAA